MNKKIVLTSIFALCIAGPAMAEGEIANASGLLQGKSCDESTLGVTEGTVNIEAIWTPNTYTITYACANNNLTPNTESMNNKAILQCAGQAMLAGGIEVNCSVTSAEYGKNFKFPRVIYGCEENGYHTTGLSCVDKNNNVTTYSLGQSLTPWAIDSNLTCTEIREGNTITLNWYDGATKQTVSSSAEDCTYGDTANDANPLTLPSNPANKAGYTFSGWKVVDNICTRLSTQQTCNANGTCFWYVDENTNTGSCLQTEAAKNVCMNTEAGNACSAIGYCDGGVNDEYCTFDSCHYMGNSTDCEVHYGCSWDNGNNECVNIILLQAGQSMLAQPNQANQGILELLG